MERSLINNNHQLRLEHMLSGWGDGSSEEDANRRDVIVAELSTKKFHQALDIGSTNDFIVSNLPALSVVVANTSYLTGWPYHEPSKIKYYQLPFYHLRETFTEHSFDLITIIDSAYKHNIGDAENLFRYNVDYLLADNGTLLTVHLVDEPSCQFSYLREKEVTFDYRGHECLIEVYVK